MTFPEKLRKLRKEKGLTQEELANAVFVSRTLITKYESGAVYPTKENAEKLALYFNIELSELIDDNDTVQLVLNQRDLSNKVHGVLSIIFASICSLCSLLSFIPCVKIKIYDYSNGSPPFIRSDVVSPIRLTLSNNNPIVLITLITLVANLVLGAIDFKIRKNIWIKLVNYILFVINLFLVFFSVVFVAIYSSNNSIDYI